MKQSNRFKLNYYDITKATLMLFITTLVAGLTTSLNSGHLPVKWEDWQPIVVAATCATVAYLLKQLFSGAQESK